MTPKSERKDYELAEQMTLVTTGHLSEPELEVLAIYRLAEVQTRIDILTLLRWKRQRALLEKVGN